MKWLDINKDRAEVIARLNSGKLGEAMSDPRLEAIRRQHSSAINTPQDNVAYLLALIDTLQRKIDESVVNCPQCGRHDFGLWNVGAVAALKKAEVKIDTLQRERDEAKRWLNNAGRAYSPCHEHQPDMWEGDGTCVICEGQSLKDQVSRLTEALRAIQLQAAGHADEFSGRVWRLAGSALLASPNQEPQPK